MTQGRRDFTGEAARGADRLRGGLAEWLRSRLQQGTRLEPAALPW